MQKELPINTTPILACYAYESYNDAIASSNGYVNDTIAIIDEISLNNDREVRNRFKLLSESITYANEDGALVFRAISPALSFKGILYLEVDGDYDLFFRVKHHLYTAPWSFISAFASTSLDEFANEDKRTVKTLYEFGYFKKVGYWKSLGDDSHSIKCIVPNNDAYWIKIVKRKEEVYSYRSIDGIEWTMVSRDTTDLCNISYTGIHIDLGESSYYNWLYSNHLQVFCNDASSGVSRQLEHFFPIDPNGFTKINPFIHEYRLPYSLVDSLNIRLMDLIRYCIDHNIYLDLPLNEKYIDNRWAYNKRDYIHYSMIFGYNDIGRTVSIYGYDQTLKVSPSIVDYNCLLKAFQQSDKQDLYLRVHKMGYSPEVLSIDMIRNLTEDYLNSKDSSWRYGGVCLKREHCVFGIAVYDSIVDNHDNFMHFLNDLRAAYFMVEHKRIMHDRVKFLSERKLLSENTSEELVNQSKEIADMASIVLMLVMKYRITGNANLIDKIKKYLLTEKEKDIAFCEKLLSSFVCFSQQ